MVSAAPAFGVDLLDDLIEEWYMILKDKSVEAKIGDWLKMLETRKKLSPEGREKDELWGLLKKIRDKEIGDHPIETTAALPPADTGEEAA